MTISKEPLRCKLEIDGTIVEKVMEFNNLGVNIGSSENLVKEIKPQDQKAGIVCNKGHNNNYASGRRRRRRKQFSN